MPKMVVELEQREVEAAIYAYVKEKVGVTGIKIDWGSGVQKVEVKVECRETAEEVKGRLDK